MSGGCHPAPAPTWSSWTLRPTCTWRTARGCRSCTACGRGRAPSPVERCTCGFVDALGLAQPTVTHHMQRLASVGLVEGDRRSRRTWYRVVPGSLEAVTSVLRPG